jgi:hypothetical protein
MPLGEIPFGIARTVASVGVRSRAPARREAMMHILTNYLVALGWAVGLPIILSEK